MPKRSSKPPRDTNQLAAHIVAITTGEVASRGEIKEKNPAAVALGRLGGLKGGKARAATMSADQRAEIARQAAKARWNKMK